jgi:hypothetical protein
MDAANTVVATQGTTKMPLLTELGGVRRGRVL